MLVHLDLTRPVNTKLAKSLEASRDAKDRLLDRRNKGKRGSNESEIPSLEQLLKLKENAVNPLSFQCEFARLTQLFQRPLQIKYCAVRPSAEDHKLLSQDAEEKSKLLTEDGEILGGQDAVQPESSHFPAEDLLGGDRA